MDAFKDKWSCLTNLWNKRFLANNPHLASHSNRVCWSVCSRSYWHFSGWLLLQRLTSLTLSQPDIRLRTAVRVLSLIVFCELITSLPIIIVVGYFENALKVTPVSSLFLRLYLVSRIAEYHHHIISSPPSSSPASSSASCLCCAINQYPSGAVPEFTYWSFAHCGSNYPAAMYHQHLVRASSVMSPYGHEQYRPQYYDPRFTGRQVSMSSSDKARYEPVHLSLLVSSSSALTKPHYSSECHGVF